MQDQCISIIKTNLLEVSLHIILMLSAMHKYILAEKSMSAKAIDIGNIIRAKVISFRLLGLNVFSISNGLYREITDNLLRHFKTSLCSSFCKLNNWSCSHHTGEWGGTESTFRPEVGWVRDWYFSTSKKMLLISKSYLNLHLLGSHKSIRPPSPSIIFRLPPSYAEIQFFPTNL